MMAFRRDLNWRIPELTPGELSGLHYGVLISNRVKPILT